MVVLETNPNLFVSKVLDDSFVFSASYCAENWRICLLSSVFFFLFVPIPSHFFQMPSRIVQLVCPLFILVALILFENFVSQGNMQATKSNDEGSILPTLKMCYIWWWGKGQQDLRQNLLRGTSHFHPLT